MKNRIFLPAVACFASVHVRKTSTGTVQKIRLISPERIDWRSCLPHLHPDDAIRRALRSLGIAQAWTQATLPGLYEAHTSPTCSEDTPQKTTGPEGPDAADDPKT